jgi:ABC-type amino acid transport substrate-binding protein
MIKLIFLFSTFLFLFSQKSVFVTCVLFEDKYSYFERELIQEVIGIYNIKNNLSLKVQYIDLISLDKMFKIKDNDTMELSIYGWTITKQRNDIFLITKPYLYSSSVILKLKNKITTNLKNIGIVKLSSHELYKNQLKNYNIHEFDNFKKMISALESREIDAIVSDITIYWAYSKKYKIVKYIEQETSDKYGILFPRSSKYFNKFNESFNYYIDSIKFLKLLRKHFGQEAVRFYNKSFKKQG